MCSIPRDILACVHILVRLMGGLVPQKRMFQLNHNSSLTLSLPGNPHTHLQLGKAPSRSVPLTYPLKPAACFGSALYFRLKNEKKLAIVLFIHFEMP